VGIGKQKRVVPLSRRDHQEHGEQVQRSGCRAPVSGDAWVAPVSAGHPSPPSPPQHPSPPHPSPGPHT
jgi:hypothetical protein